MEQVRKQMRRMEDLGPRFLTFSCHQRLPLLGRPEWRDAFAESVATARARCGFRLLAWVAMPEHVHLILVPGNACKVSRILVAIKQPIAQQALHRWRSEGAPILPKLEVSAGRHRYWQAGGGFDRLVRDDDELEREVRYIHANPVRRGLVAQPTDWPWSSARWYAGDKAGAVPIDRANP